MTPNRPQLLWEKQFSVRAGSRLPCFILGSVRQDGQQRMKKKGTRSNELVLGKGFSRSGVCLSRARFSVSLSTQLNTGGADSTDGAKRQSGNPAQHLFAC